MKPAASLRSAVSGLIATIPMTWAMVKLFDLFPNLRQSELPPKQITQESLQKLDVNPSQKGLRWMSWLAHFGFGMMAALPYDNRPAERSHEKMIFRGSVYGLSVWASSYMGWLPLFNFKTKAQNFKQEKNISMILAHIVWGVALVYADDYLRRRTYSKEV